VRCDTRTVLCRWNCLWNASVQKPAWATTDFPPLHLLLDWFDWIFFKQQTAKHSADIGKSPRRPYSHWGEDFFLYLFFRMTLECIMFSEAFLPLTPHLPYADHSCNLWFHMLSERPAGPSGTNSQAAHEQQDART